MGVRGQWAEYTPHRFLACLSLRRRYVRRDLHREQTVQECVKLSCPQDSHGRQSLWYAVISKSLHLLPLFSERTVRDVAAGTAADAVVGIVLQFGPGTLRERPVVAADVDAA